MREKKLLFFQCFEAVDFEIEAVGEKGGKFGGGAEGEEAVGIGGEKRGILSIE